MSTNVSERAWVLRIKIACALIAAFVLLGLSGCTISTPDTADSGTGLQMEGRWPWDCRKCPEPKASK